jgi:hypothetical protein
MGEEPHRTESHSATSGDQESVQRPWWHGLFGENLARFRNREEHEQYMDSLEWQMEHHREQIDRTLEQTTEDSDRRRKALERLRSSLPSFPGRTPVRGAPGREESIQPIRSGTPSAREESPRRKRSEPRSWWRRMFGGA